MKNKIKIRRLILPVLCVISISSCKKESGIEKSDVNKISEAINIENGYLKFRDQKSFDSLINILIKPENFNARPNELANFKSYRDVFLEIEKEYENVNTGKSFDDFKNKYSDLVYIKSDSSLTYKFGTPLSALFINVNGEVKVGDVTTVYTEDSRMISYTGKHKDKQQIMSIRNTDATQGVFVSNISKSASIAITENTYGPTTTSAIKSELYYNEDGKRRLFVDLWKENTPRTDGSWTPPELPSRVHYYFTSKQELKKTFGGWRTNETDYYFSNLNYSYSYYNPPIANPVTHNFNLPSYSVGNASGPIIIDVGTTEGFHTGGISGTGRFFTGGVSNAPSFNVN
ncbi:hypothetical protein ACS5PU_00475 [Pedobacter sp. GSP4]|uniref:hypothetical protein n=1 Tax=Pedobacter sp. GSP4 TaxID=3453716 RepID=UPI003EEAB225